MTTPVSSSRAFPDCEVDERLLILFRVDPLHHAAQLLAGLFDLMGSFATLDGLERRLVGLVFQNPFLGKLAGLDFVQNLLHFCLGLFRDDSWATGVIAEFSGV